MVFISKTKRQELKTKMGVILLNNIDSEKEKWKKQKSMGKLKFILIYGVLLWGGSFTIVYSVFTLFFNPIPRNYNVSDILSRFIMYAIIWGLCGIFVGNTQWNKKVRQFDNK